MPKTANEVFRDFVRFTGDGLPGEPANAPLPHGDERSGVHHPSKADIRECMQGAFDAAEEAEQWADLAGEYAATSTGTPQFSSRALAQAATIPSAAVWMIVDGLLYRRDASGTALVAGDASRWSPAPNQPLTPQHFGAVADGAIAVDEANIFAPTGTGAVTGTDNRAAFVAMLAYAGATGRAIHIPEGMYRVRVPNQSQSLVLTAPSDLVMTGVPGKSWIIIDDNPAYTAVGQTGNVFLGHPEVFQPTNYTHGINKRFILRGVGFWGTWWRDIERGGRSWTAAQPYRVHAIGPSNCAEVVIENCYGRDIMGMFSRAETCRSVTFLNNDLARIAGDGLRAKDADRGVWHGNRVLHCDDDAIAWPDSDDIPVGLRPRRMMASVSDNTIIASEGIAVLGPHAISLSGNKLMLCYGTGIAAVANTSAVSDMGEGGFVGVSAIGNMVLNHMAPSARAATPNGAWAASDPYMTFRGAFASAINTPTAPGDSIVTPGSLPWAVGSGGPNWGGMHLANQVAGASGPRGQALTGGGNILKRTLPVATAYSAWGFGKRFSRWGFDDPAVATANFASIGLQFSGSFAEIDFGLGVISGMIDGWGVYLRDASTDGNYRNVRLHGGIVSNVFHGIHSDAGNLRSHDIEIAGVTFDIDPYRQASARNGNSWTTVTADGPTGVHLSYLRGVTIRGCRFLNCANMWTLEAGAPNYTGYNTLIDNVGVVDFTTLSSTNPVEATNRGVGRILPVSQAVTYEVRDLSLTATYGLVRDGMRAGGAALPTSGHYVMGHEYTVRTTSAATKYVRLTTGTNHAVGTDWVAL